MLIFVVDSLKGFPDAFTATFPATLVQTCIVRPIRQSRNLCCWKDRRAVRSGGS
ncbi:MAG: transposase [Natronohydrobacter sp.]|nr:transposase [Natronohydrobacter sp.]